MAFGATMLAMSAVQGIGAIAQGNAKSAEDKYNASITSNQSQIIQAQGDITQGQYTRQAGQLLSTSYAHAGAAGIEPTGSAAAAMLDAQTQIHSDMAIAQFNTTMGINTTNQNATLLRQKASMDSQAGYTNAFTDILQGASDFAAYNHKTTFDTSTASSDV